MASVDVGEDRRRADVADRVGGGDERQRRHDRPRRPGRRRAAISARCRAVVQELTATPCAAPTRRGERLLERGDPGALGDPAGADRVGRGLRLLLARAAGSYRDPALLSRHPARTCRRARRATSRPGPAGPRAGRSRRGSRALAAAALVSARRRVTPLTARAGPCSGARSDFITSLQRLGQLLEAGLGAAGDVEHLVGDVGARRPGCWRGRCRRRARSPSSAGRRRGSAAACPTSMRSIQRISTSV